MQELELYVHIPFCVQKCKYCDFLSFSAEKRERQEYVESLCKKIRSCGKIAEASVLVSIFIGGGTPSVLEPEQTEEIFRAIYDTFCVKEGAEITTELNPGTVTKEKLDCYRKLGINRLSIGLQSVKDQELKLLGRIHTYDTFLDTYHMARAAEFTNINVDLISAIPGQTVESWEKTLRTVADLNPEHISAYSLIIEEGTPFYELYGEEKGAVQPEEQLPDEEAERLMYEKTKEILEEYGYHRYEISNYAKKGYHCEHNEGYWLRRPYLGVGLGAASFMEQSRWIETRDMATFLDTAEMKKEEEEHLSIREQMEETMILGLRRMEGVSKASFFKQYGVSMESVFQKELEKLEQQNLLQNEEERVLLTERGIDVSNTVFCEFIAE